MSLVRPQYCHQIGNGPLLSPSPHCRGRRSGTTGQFEGYRVRLPVFLGRRPDETVDEELRAFDMQLLVAAAGSRHGDWALCAATGWPDNHSYDQLLAWSWTDGQHRSLVVVNYADAPASARIESRPGMTSPGGQCSSMTCSPE